MKVHAAEMSTRRLTGMGTVATLALAVLVFGCVLGATAGTREALEVRTQALLQTLLGHIPPAERTITVSSSWSGFVNRVAVPPILTNGQLSNLEGQFNRDFSRGVLHLAPVSADWVSMTTGEQGVYSALSGTGHLPVQMEVSYRLPYRGYVRVLAGSLSAPAPAASGHIAGFFPAINVAVTRQTAGMFALKVGSAIRTAGPPLPSSGLPSTITLRVTAIVAESHPASSFWAADPSLAVPELNVPGSSPPYWTAGVFALPDESAAVQQDYGPGNLNLQWVLPVNFSGLRGDQAPQLAAALHRVVSEDPQLIGPLAAGATPLTVSTGLQQTLGTLISTAATFVGTAAAVDALLWLLYVSLAVTATIAPLLAARS